MRSRILGSVALVSVLAVAVLTVRIGLDPGPTEPTAQQWRAARDVIQKDFETGDGIRVHPFWLREAAAVLGTVRGRSDLQTWVDVSIPPDPMFSARHERLWVVSALGRTDATVPEGAERELSEKVAPGLLVERYRLPASPIARDLITELASATVERFGPRTKRRRCTWRKETGQHDCRGRGWENVSLRLEEAGGAPRRCIVLHPYPDGATVSITWSGVTLGAGVLVRSGLTLESARNEKGSRTTLRVEVDGETLGSHVHEQSSWEWSPTWVPTADRAGEEVELTLAVHAPNEKFRDLCVDAYVLSSEPDFLQR